MRFLNISFVTCLIMVLAGHAVYAQGTLKGKVTDEFENEPLIGASVMIMGTSLGASSDEDGNYIIRRVPAGEAITVRFSYIGYGTKTFEITLEDQETRELNVQLGMSSIEGAEIQISGQAVGQVAAINQQRSSNTIVNVISAEKIRELPDANAAESIGRLPGVSVSRSGGEANKVVLRGLSDKYLTVTVDGVKLPTTDALSRGLDLSAISQNSLSGIELYKAVTPDKDADAIAGSINLVTRKAPSTRDLQVTAKGGYNGIMQSFGQYDVNMRYGERFFNDLIGIQLHGNIEDKIRSNERISIGYTDIGAALDDYFISDLNLNFIDEMRSRRGAGAIFDINTPDAGNIKLNVMYSSTTRDYITHSRNYPKNVGSVTYTYRDQEQTIDLLTTSLIGDNRLLGLDVDWTVSYSRSRAEFPFDYEATFIEPSTSGTSGMMSGSPTLKDNPHELIPFAYNNFQAASLSDAYYRTQDNSDGEFTTNLNLSRGYTLGNIISGTLKGGAKYTTKNRTNQNTRAFAPYRLGYWRGFELAEDGSVVNKDFSGTHFEEFYNNYLANSANTQASFIYFLSPDPDSKVILDHYNMNPLISRERFRQWYHLNKNGINQAGTLTEYHNDPSAEANTYDITESVTAGYLMNTMNFGQKITAIIGARIEHEHHDYSNTYSPRQIGGFPIPVGSTRDTTSTYSETVFLPHLHINLKPTEYINVRLAAYKALARPDFNMRLLSFFAWREAETGGDRILVLGNPKLKTAQAWNYEVNTSFYGNKLGLFSVSAFYKRIDNMYHMLNGIATSGDTLINNLGLDWSSPHTGSYELTVPYNSPETTDIYGFEFEHQINFTWLPGLLKNIVLSYNASVVRSETTLIGATRDTTYVPDPIFGQRPVYTIRPITTKQKLENQPELFGNISLGYDIGGFSGRLSLFHQSEYYRSYSPTGSNDRVVGAFTRLDLALKYQIIENLLVVANVNNILNIEEKDIRHNQEVGYRALRSNERYGTTFDFGIRYQL